MIKQAAFMSRLPVSRLRCKCAKIRTPHQFRGMLLDEGTRVYDRKEA